MSLKQFQDRFQRAILEDDDAVLADITDGPRAPKRELLGIYRDAYMLRLIDVIASDYEQLRAYLGQERFRAMAKAYVAAHPSRHPNARWASHRLPEFLRVTHPYRGQPVLGELAAIERALNDAFDGADAPAIGVGELAAVPASSWGRIAFRCNPTARCLPLATNACALWHAMRAGAEPPAAGLLDGPAHILVWRCGTTSMLRALEPEEAMAWQQIQIGRTFGEVCQSLAACDRRETAPTRAAGYLKGWLDAGLLAALTPAL